MTAESRPRLEDATIKSTLVLPGHERCFFIGDDGRIKSQIKKEGLRVGADTKSIKIPVGVL